MLKELRYGTVSGRHKHVYLQGFFASPLTDSTVDPLLTMRSDRQPVATPGNGFRLF